MENLLPKIAEFGLGFICVGGLLFLVYWILKITNDTTNQALKDNKEQTEKFVETTEKFCQVVEKHNIQIDIKLDKISDKIDNLRDRDR